MTAKGKKACFFSRPVPATGKKDYKETKEAKNFPVAGTGRRGGGCGARKKRPYNCSWSFFLVTAGGEFN